MAAYSTWARKVRGPFPGPPVIGRGGTLPTVTDAAAVLGFIDGEYFLGGHMQLDLEQAGAAVERDVRGRCKEAG